MTSEPLRVLLVGYGRMGRMVEQLCPAYGCDVAAIFRSRGVEEGNWRRADVAIDFSAGEAVLDTVRRLGPAGVPIVIGTTGWREAEAEVRQLAAQHELGIVASANFALGVHIFLALARLAGELFAERPEFGAWIHELHHVAKRDAPSGTAILLRQAVEGGGFTGQIDVASTRAGAIPGTHTLGFDAAAETLTITHTARDRTAFARGALQAARWLRGRRGWFTMADIVGG